MSLLSITIMLDVIIIDNHVIIYFQTYVRITHMNDQQHEFGQ